MTCRYALLLSALLATAPAVAQPVPDTLWAPADSLIAFGWSVDADGGRALVGARVWPPPALASRSDPKGVAFVYRLLPDGTWEVEGRLESDDVGIEDCFSLSLDLLGDLAAIGAQCEAGLAPDGTARWGAVYLFRRTPSGWVREAKLHPFDVPGPPPSDPRLEYFGQNLSLEEDRLVIGQPRAANPSNPDEDGDSGAAYVFERREGRWAYVATLRNEDADAALGERFGSSVVAVGDEVLVGAASEGPDPSRRGAVYVFRREGTGWAQQAKLLAPTPTADERFGLLLATDRTDAAVGSADAVYPLERQLGTWRVGVRLAEGFSYAPAGVARYEDRVLTLNPSYPVAEGLLFAEEGAGWSETALPVTTPDPVWQDDLVALSERYAFIGHPSFDADGYVLLYDLARLTDSEPAAADAPGLSLTVSPNPARGGTTLHFTLPTPAPVRLTVYDVLGREVRSLHDGALPAGQHTARLDTAALPAGVYPVRLQAGTLSSTRIVTVVR